MNQFNEDYILGNNYSETKSSPKDDVDDVKLSNNIINNNNNDEQTKQELDENEPNTKQEINGGEREFMLLSNESLEPEEDSNSFSPPKNNQYVLEEANFSPYSGKKRPRPAYKCHRCGQPKKGHVCALEDYDTTLNNDNNQTDSPTQNNNSTNSKDNDETSNINDNSNNNNMADPKEKDQNSSNQSETCNVDIFALKDLQELIPNQQIKELSYLPFYLSWFDQTFCSLTMLQEFFSYCKPNFSQLPDLMNHITKEKQKLTEFRKKFEQEMQDESQFFNSIGYYKAKSNNDQNENSENTNLNSEYLNSFFPPNKRLKTEEILSESSEEK